MEPCWRVEGPSAWRGPRLAGTLGNQQVDERPTVSCRWCTAWIGGWSSQRLPPLHPPPSNYRFLHDSTAIEESPSQLCVCVYVCVGRGGESSMYSWVTASRSEPQGEGKFTLNGKQVYPVTSALVCPHVVISVPLTSGLIFPFVLPLTVSWPALSLLLTDRGLSGLLLLI